MRPAAKAAFAFFEHLFAIIFFAELVVRLAAFGCRSFFLSSKSNCLDSVVVVVDVTVDVTVDY